MRPEAARRPVVLCIGGSDSSGRAGLAADVRSVEALGATPVTAVTAVTVQDEGGLQACHLVPPAFVGRQVRLALDRRGPAAVKLGMAGSGEVVSALAAELVGLSDQVPLVIDPVLAASTGEDLLASGGAETLVAELWPLARLVTPNLPEAAAFLGLAPEISPRWSRAEREGVARRLLSLGPAAVLLKGGHAAGGACDDLLLDEGGATWFTGERIALPDAMKVRGTGCTLASAIAAALAGGQDLPTSCRSAREHVRSRLTSATRTARRDSAG